MFNVKSTVRKGLSKLTAGVAVLALAACAGGPMRMSGGPTVNGSDPVQVALLVPYESGQASDVALARSLENAARLALADLADTNIDLRVYPTAGQAERASAAANQAVSDGAKVILGPVYGGSAKLAGLAAAGAGVNVLSFSNNPEVAGGNVFILGPTFQNTANRLARYASRNGRSKFMIVNGDNAAENAGAAAIRGALGRNGGQVVAEHSFPLSQDGVVGSVTPIEQKAKSSGADAVFFTSGNDGAMPILAQMLPERGLRSPDPQYIGLQRWNVPASALSLPGLQGSWFTLPDQAMTQNFSARYTSTYGSSPHSLAGLAYDGVAAVGALLETGNSRALTAQALTRSSGFAGVNGVFRLLPDGTNERGLSIVTIQNNQVVEIDPAPRSFGGFGF